MSKRRKDRLYMRGRIFSFKYKDPDTGKWREKFTGTQSREEARQFRDEFLRDLQDRTLPGDKASWTVEDAATLWVKNHAPHLTSQKARSNELSYLRQLVNLLGEKKLKHLTLDDLKEYQQERGERVQARPINIELGILVKVLKEENLWRGSLEGFKRLREPKSVIGQALSIEELGHLEFVARSKDAWQVAYYAETLACNTGLRGGEIKKLRLCNLDLQNRRIEIEREGTKSDAGGRLIQLNQAATSAACKLYVRAQSIGASEPEHYLLPANLSRHTKKLDPLKGKLGFDVTRHQQSWDTAWRNLRKTAAASVIDAAKEAGRELKMSERETVARFRRLRFHDLRHSFISMMAERNVPLPVVQAMVGHMSAEMTRYYTQISDRAQRDAVELLDKARKPVTGAECGEFCGETPSEPQSEAAKLLN